MCWEIIKLVSVELSGSGKWICKKYIPNNTIRYYFRDDGVPHPLKNLDGFNPIGKEIIIFTKNNMYRVCLQKPFIIPNLILAYIYIVQVNECMPRWDLERTTNQYSFFLLYLTVQE